MPRPRKYPAELLDRSVRLVLESGPPITHVAADLSIHPETLRKRVRQADAGPRNELVSSEEREELKRLRGEVRELRRANEIIKSASVKASSGLAPGSRCSSTLCRASPFSLNG
jgi:transposase